MKRIACESVFFFETVSRTEFLKDVVLKVHSKHIAPLGQMNVFLVRLTLSISGCEKSPSKSTESAFLPDSHGSEGASQR